MTWQDCPSDPRTHVDVDVINASDLLGENNFKVLPFSAGKSSAYEYSELLDKVFVTTGKECPIRFNIENVSWDEQLYLRALLTFCEADQTLNVPRRCTTHINSERGHRISFPWLHLNHLIRICDDDATYYEDISNGRTSVRVPITPLTSNSTEYTLMFKFMCDQSCLGWSDTKMVFLLEGERGVTDIRGRATLSLRMCISPARAKEVHERRLRHNQGRQAERRRDATHLTRLFSEDSDLESSFDLTMSPRETKIIRHANPKSVATPNSIDAGNGGSVGVGVDNRGGQNMDVNSANIEEAGVRSVTSPNNVHAQSTSNEHEPAKLVDGTKCNVYTGDEATEVVMQSSKAPISEISIDVELYPMDRNTSWHFEDLRKLRIIKMDVTDKDVQPKEEQLCSDNDILPSHSENSDTEEN